jgi:hypothetical protein
LDGKKNEIIRKVIFNEMKVIYGKRKGCEVWKRMEREKILKVKEEWIGVINNIIIVRIKCEMLIRI